MRIQTNKNAFVLAYSLLFSFLVVSSLTVYMTSVINSYAISNRLADLKKAYYVADAGMADAFIQLRSYASSPGSFAVNNASFAVGGGRTGSYNVNVTASGTTWKSYQIASTGTYHGVTKRLVLSVAQSAVSSFAYLSNTEIHPVYGALWWVTGMLTVGPVRTNGTLNVWGSPMFDGTTTQTGAGVNYYHGGPPLDDPDYVNGLTVSAPSLPFAAVSMLSNIKSAANAGFVLEGNTSVTFLADGTITVSNSDKGWTNRNMAAPTNKVIYVKNGNATVQGTINGQITVAAEREVYISGNLVYKTDPRTNPASTDMLGLVAKNNVTVLANSAPTNLEIDAAMIALTGSFQVDEWWIGGKGNMIQYGSLVNNYCGPTGVFNATTGQLTGGYNQLQYYDDRLLTNVPPGIPPAVDSTGRILYVKTGFLES